MNIDWSKAPEGFPLWLEGTNEEHRKHSGWYRDAGQVFEGAYGGQWRACREGQFFTVHRNPGPSNWTGEGLPPVGTVCEHQPYEDQEDWHQVEIIAHKNTGLPVAVFWDEAGQRATYSSHEAFRPIRTPEQVAADKRLHEIRNALTAIKAGQQQFPNDLVRGNIVAATVEAMIDVGYRKQPTP